jgi:alkaline phosphatase D
MRLSRRAALAGLALGSAASNAAAAPRSVRFDWGVASGDPLPDSVVLWTRALPQDGAPVSVQWIVARDPQLRRVVKRGTFETTATRDHTVKLIATGLKPGETYHYGFRVGAVRSPVGRFRTAPVGALAQWKIAQVSCSNHPAGYFNAYRVIADRGDVDLVLHLGDYIYEYGPGGYGTEFGQKVGRVPDPPKEIVTLSDYRTRLAQYRTDPDLQAAHACAAWVVTWDDHETTNDSWVNGAENHNPDKGEGDWKTRERAALQAYYEWMPIREPGPGAAFAAINRNFQFGDLLTLTMLETRLLARSQQLAYETDLTFAPFDVTASPPAKITDPARLAGLDPRNPPAGVRMLPDLETFYRTKLADPARTMMGSAQEDWFAAQMQASVKAGVKWQAIGNQVMMARVNAPNLAALITDAQKAEMAKTFPPFVQYVELSRFNVPLNLDAWDGYPAARERLYAAAKAAGAHLVVHTGDIHSNWCCALTTDNGKTRLGAEIVCTSVTSPGFGDLFQAAGMSKALMEQPVVDANAEVLWHDESARGYVLNTYRPDGVTAEFFELDTVYSKTFKVVRAAAYRVAPSSGPGVGPIERV